MKSEELKEWFLNLYNSCYVVKHDDYPLEEYLYYDENFARTIKMSQILEREVVYPDKVVGKCLFKLDWRNKWIYIDYDEIWKVLGSKLSCGYMEIQILIKTWLNGYNTLKEFKPTCSALLPKN